MEWLDLDSESRLRFFSKFGESSFAPLLIIIGFYKDVSSKLRSEEEIESQRLKTLAEFNITAEQLALMEKDEQELKHEKERQLLRAHQNTLSVVLAWMCIEYQQLRKVIVSDEGISVEEIRHSLMEYYKEIKEGSLDSTEEGSTASTTDQHEQNMYDKSGRKEKVEVLIKNNDLITCDMLETLASQLE